MKFRKRAFGESVRDVLSLATLWLLLAAVISSVYAQDYTNTPPAGQADNSAVNVRDRDMTQPTADRATNNLSDREIMSRIRKNIVEDNTISTYGHNVKVIAVHGHVTLKGPVTNAEERRNIKTKAAQVVGARNVTDELSSKGISNR